MSAIPQARVHPPGRWTPARDSWGFCDPTNTLPCTAAVPEVHPMPNKYSNATESFHQFISSSITQGLSLKGRNSQVILMSSHHVIVPILSCYYQLGWEQRDDSTLKTLTEAWRRHLLLFSPTKASEVHKSSNASFQLPTSLSSPAPAFPEHQRGKHKVNPGKMWRCAARLCILVYLLTWRIKCKA